MALTANYKIRNSSAPFHRISCVYALEGLKTLYSLAINAIFCTNFKEQEVKQ